MSAPNNIAEVLTRNGLDAEDIGWSKRSLKTDGASMRDVLGVVKRLQDEAASLFNIVATSLDGESSNLRSMARHRLDDARALIAEVLR